MSDGKYSGRSTGSQKRAFQRFECGRCHHYFHFSEVPRVTRIPRCPACGNLDGHELAA